MKCNYMFYDIELFTRIIDFIVQHDDEPECYLQMKDGTEVEFICYKHCIDAYIGEKYFKFNSITDFLDNMQINNVPLRKCWGEVDYLGDNNDSSIDWTKEPTEQFLVIDGKIWYRAK